MNDRPHTHQIEFGTGRGSRKNLYGYKITPANATKIKYGDQYSWWPVFSILREKRRERKIKRIIIRHNKESVKAGIRHSTAMKLTSYYAKIATESAEKAWAK